MKRTDLARAVEYSIRLLKLCIDMKALWFDSIQYDPL